jgi:hypothetical protein
MLKAAIDRIFSTAPIGNSINSVRVSPPRSRKSLVGGACTNSGAPWMLETGGA